MSAEYSVGEAIEVMKDFSRIAGLTGAISLEDLIRLDDSIAVIAERIKADEVKALGTCPTHGVEYVGECSGCAMTLPEKDFTYPPAQAGQVDVYEAYKTWPDDIRKKLSLHDLRRMGGWAAKSPVSDWRIDTSAGRPILCYQDCSVIESEQARYVLNLISADQNQKPTAEPVAQGEVEGFDAWHDAKWPEPAAYHHKVYWRQSKAGRKVAWDAAIAAQPRAVTDGAWPKMELWFFRDLTSAQRLALFALHSLPVDEIGESHVNQKRMLRHLLAATPLPAAQPRAVTDVAAMVNRFLGWRLPDDFCPDGGISFTHVTDPAWTHDSWPIGTNLFTADQAEQMFRYMLAATPSPGESA